MDQNDDFGTGAATGAKMIVAALVSAVLTATLVIAVGQSMIHRSTLAAPQSQPLLIRTSG